MGAGHKLRILHLSDLHIGKESMSAWRMERVIGPAWDKNLQEIAADGPIDLVCFTGDLAQSGVAEQYQAATEFVEQMLATLNVPRERFFCVPGNHDVNRKEFPDAWKELRSAGFELGADILSRWMAAGKDCKPPRGFENVWRDQVIARQAAYRDWLASMGFSAMLPGAQHARLGYRVSLDLGLGAPLHIIGLDSAWLAGDNDDAGKLRLTGEQIGLLLTEGGKKLPGWSIALMHHPMGDLADAADSQRLLSEYGAGLLLHGHLHDPDIIRWNTPSASLHVSSAGCLYQDTNYPNSFQILDVALPQGQAMQPQCIWARAWDKRGHWFSDNGPYPGSKDGRFNLLPDGDSGLNANLPFTGGVFIGRDSQLQQICAALLPQAGQAFKPTVVCCTVEGMAGVGKTRLAEEFVQRYWLPALGVGPEANPAQYYLRLVLEPQAGEKPSATGLAQQLADRLRCGGDVNSLWPRLRAALQAGAGGFPQLVLIENVDAEAQAVAVAQLINHLQGCPILVTARYQRFGDGTWTRVAVAPMSADDARKLLLAEVGGEGHALSPAEADELALALGYLPLALHIAASHLKQGLPPKAFLRELRSAGLELSPAEQGDIRLSTDRARAIIRSSFELSWRHWLAGRGAEPAWQQALVALAHGPAASTGVSLSAAIAGLEEDDYPAFAVAAARLSLLQYTAKDQQSSIHPLIAEFLRSKALPDAVIDAPAVLNRIKAWFVQRLPLTNDEKQKQAWGQVWSEVAALGHCLQLLTKGDVLEIDRAGRRFAIRLGPYALWRDFYTRWVEADAFAEPASGWWWVLSELARKSGDPEQALVCARNKEKLDRASGDERGVALALGQIADVLQARGDLDEALRIRRDEQLPVYEKLGDVRERALTMGQIADVLQARGDLDEAMRIRRDEEIPVYEKLGDVRSRAVTMGQIAEVLQARGDLDEALRIRREEEIPVYDKLGDVRLLAVTMGYIADVLQARGDLDEALRIRRDEQLPVYEKLGDVRGRAVTMGKIADVLQARGDLDEALRILREELLPVFDKLGDVRARAVTMGKIADVLQARGDLDEALRIHSDELLPVFDKLGDVLSRAVTMGKIADVQQARGDLDEALRIRRDEEIPVYEKLGDARSYLIGQTNLAICLAIRGKPEDRTEIAQLLQQAYTAAQGMRIPEAAQIARFFKQIFDEEIPTNCPPQ